MIGPLISLGVGLAGAKLGTMVAGFFGWSGTMASVLAGVGYMAGSILTSETFGEETDVKMPQYAKYPVQTSQKSSPVAKVYGTDIQAGNIIWAGDPVPWVRKVKVADQKSWWDDSNIYAKEHRYKRSFLIGVCEGPAQVVRIWKGKEQIYPTVAETVEPLNVLLVGAGGVSGPSSSYNLYIFEGSDNQGIKNLTDKDYGEYPNLCCLFFNEYDTGPTEQIPNFVIEVSTATGYKYTYISENATIWGVPLYGSKMLTLDAGGLAVDEGGGIVSLPCRGHPFVAGDVVQISGSVSYNGLQTLTAATTDDRLAFAKAYTAETFAGTETLVKKIASLTSGIGKMDQDDQGNIYYGHNWDAAHSTFVLKIEPDGTKVYDCLNPSPAWNSPTSTVVGLKVSSDSRYLYVYFGTGIYNAYLFKFDLTTGDELWRVDTSDSGKAFQIGLDGDDNIYVRGRDGVLGDYKVQKWAAADGAKLATYAACPFGYALWVDVDMGIVIAGGTPSGGYNLWAGALDGPDNDFVMLGTELLGTGHVLTWGGHIYVLGNDGTTPMLYKLSWSSSTLSVVTSVEAPPYAAGFYVDLWGHLVVINQDWTVTQTDVFWFYDADLNYLSKVSPLPSMLTTWDAPVGGAYIRGSAVFYPGGFGGGDANPADVIEDILTDTRTGARFPSSYIDADSFAAVRSECYDQDLLISLVLSDQRPWQDWVDLVCSHFGGYLVWSEGKFKLGMWRAQTPVAVITERDLKVLRSDEPGEEREPPMKVRKRNFTQTYNRVHASWSSRQDEYGPACAVFDEEVDQRQTGTTRLKTVDLSALKTGSRAQKVVNRVGFDSLRRHSIYSFALGYQSMLLEVGDVIDLSDGEKIENAIVRITSISESKDGGHLQIEAMDDDSHLYPDIGWTTQETTAQDYTPPTLADATIGSREDLDERILYFSIAPGNAQCNGWHIYVSRDDMTYDFIGTKSIEAVTEGKANSVGTLQTAMRSANAVVHRYGESFDVNIGTVTDFKTNITDAQLFSERSLAKIGDEIIGYKNAVEISAGVWRISNVIRGLFGTWPVAHSAGETFATLDIDVVYPFRPADIGTTLYIKALAWYGAYEQDLSDVTATQVAVQGFYQRPAPATLIRMTADEIDGGFGAYSGADFTLYWNMCMKPACRSLGQDGTPWKYEDPESDLVVDDSVLLDAYHQDPELSGIDLQFEQPDGTNISQRMIAVAGSETITKATDLGGLNPAQIKVLPRRVLRTYKQNEITVDDGS